MNFDKLYELAFEYKKTKLWKKLYDLQIFAVKLSGERIGYISIMGAAGEHCAIALYIGGGGFSSFKHFTQYYEYARSPFDYHERFMRQDCLQCSFENKNMLSEEEIVQAKDFAARHNIKLAGRRAYPQFVSYKPFCCPWHLQNEEQIEDLCMVLSACIDLSKRLAGKRPEALGISFLNVETTEVPMLEFKDGSFIMTKAELPSDEPEVLPVPKTFNDINIAKIKRLKRFGVWEAEIVRFPEPVQENEEDVPVFPAMIFAVETSAEHMLSPVVSVKYDEEPEVLLNSFTDTLLDANACPKTISVRDERTYVFLKGLCERLGVSLRLEDDLPTLTEAEIELWDQLNSQKSSGIGDEIYNILGSLLNLDEDALSDLPDMMFKQFEVMLEQGVLPKKIEDLLERICEKRYAGKPKGKKIKAETVMLIPNKSYVISVSVGTGCYRHIRISSESTLFDLHSAILDAFEFYDDHAHAFFMDNQRWSDKDCYFMRGVEDGGPATDEYTLNEVGLYEGMQFKFLFDFGDEWVFQCKVLKADDEVVSEPRVIRSKGEAPEQYYYDDEWEDE